MNIRLSISLAILAISLLPLAQTTPAWANHFAVEQIACQLHDQAGQLSAEIRGNFRQAPNFGQLVADSQQIYGLSAQLKALSRGNVNPNQVAASVRRMERLVADLENRVQDANAFRGRVGYRGYGPPVAPCDTRLAMRMLSGLDRTLANLDDAIDDMCRAPRQFQPQPYGGFENGYGAPGPGYGNPGNGGPIYRGRGF